jgi:hypothetical protein
VARDFGNCKSEHQACSLFSSCMPAYAIYSQVHSLQLRNHCSAPCVGPRPDTGRMLWNREESSQDHGSSQRQLNAIHSSHGFQLCEIQIWNACGVFFFLNEVTWERRTQLGRLAGMRKSEIPFLSHPAAHMQHAHVLSCFHSDTGVRASHSVPAPSRM